VLSAGIGLAALEALTNEAFVSGHFTYTTTADESERLLDEGDLLQPESVATAVAERLRADDLSLDGLILCAATYGNHQRHMPLRTPDSEWDEGHGDQCSQASSY